MRPLAIVIVDPSYEPAPRVFEGRSRARLMRASTAGCEMSSARAAALRLSAVLAPGQHRIADELYAYDEDRLIDACARARRSL